MKNILTKKMGLCYGPYRDGQNPVTEIHPSASQIEEDLQILKNHGCEKIRTFSCEHPIPIAEIAGKYNITVAQGVWIDEKQATGKEDLEKAALYTKKYKNITEVIIGDEVISRHYAGEAILLEYLKSARKKIKLPISTSEFYLVWESFPEIVKQVDFIGLSYSAYRQGIAHDEVINKLVEQINSLKKLYPDKQVCLIDIGWPTGGKKIGKAVPSINNQKHFIEMLNKLMVEENFSSYLFEAFDEPWKRMLEGEVGAHWGIFTKERKFK